MPLARGSVRGALLGIGASGVGTVGLVLVVFACVSRTATPFLVGGGEGQAAASVGDDPVASPALGPGGTGGTAGPIDAQDLDEGEPEDGATGEPGTENPDPGEHAEPVASGDGWVSDLHLVHGQDPVDWYRWTPKNELLYLTPHGYEIFGDDGSRQIAGEDLEIALEQTSRAWEHKKAKWTVEFDVYRPDGILDCDETQDVVEARFDVCMRKAKTRCNTVTFLQAGEMGFPWSPDDLGVGLEGLDLVAFPKGPHVILGRRDMIILFELDPKPEKLVPPEPPGEGDVDPCWQYLSSEPEVTFVRVETLDDLVSYMHYLPGSPYTVDGTGYIFPAPDGIRLARFDADLPEVLVVPLEFEARFAVWSPFNDRISIIDGDRRLWVAEVVAPDLPVVVVAESEIHE